MLHARPIAALALAGLLLTTMSCARSHPGVHTLEVGRAFLWQVSDPEQDDHRLYLLGSIHLLDEPMVLGPRLSSLFDESQELLVELDPRSADPFLAFATIQHHAYLAPRQSLREFVDDVTYERLGRFLERHPIPPILLPDLDRARPWLLVFWAVSVTLEESALEDSYGVDVFFLERAGQTKPIGSLETMNDQIEAFANVPDAVQAAELEKMLAAWDADAAETSDELLEVARAWKEGEADRLQAMFAFNPDFGAHVIDRRNETMTSTLVDRLLRGGERFVVVGTAHLLGEKGIPELLRERGYDVEAMR